MGLLSFLKRKKEEPVANEPIPEDDLMPLPDSAPEPTEFGPDLRLQQPMQPSSYQQPMQQSSNQQPIQPPASDDQFRSQLEVINSKLDMLKMQLENINQAITVINTKIK
ncbi:MAG: hypothetical protein WC307_04255 [Candidatus Nanoarchaeia archaeon]|jgi:hypothetical protein